MLRLAFALLMGGASTACALAAVGWTLYAQHPQALWAAQCFAAWGFGAGLACGVLHLRAHGRPVHAPPTMPAEELAGLVRAALARARRPAHALPPRATCQRRRRRQPVEPLVTPMAPPRCRQGCGASSRACDGRCTL